MNGLIQLLQQIIPSKTYNVSPAAGGAGTQNSAIPNVHEYGKGAGTFQMEKSDVPGGIEKIYYPPGMTPNKALKASSTPAGGMVPGQFYTGWSPKPKGPVNPKSADFDYLGDWTPPFPVKHVSQRSLMGKAQ